MVTSVQAKPELTREPNASAPDVLPTLFGAGYGEYAVHPKNFILSFLLHTLAMILLLTSSVYLAKHHREIKQQVVSVFVASPYVLPPAPDQAGGGGGGGDLDKLAASKGSPPRFTREQLAPPRIVPRNDDPKLTAEATVVGPPKVTFPQAQTGDPLANVLSPASNGTGSGGGIGSGSGTGVGSGRGPGVGPGWGGGIGGGAYRVGGGVSAPRVIYAPDPEYSEEARKAKFQGTVVLAVVIGPDGKTRDVRIQRSLGMGLDEKAMEAVRTWKFDPSRKDGQPVAVLIAVEVNFRLY